MRCESCAAPVKPLPSAEAFREDAAPGLVHYRGHGAPTRQGPAYVSIDGHKSDDLRPYVYVTRDYGSSWASISANLPDFGNVNTVRQDPRNEDILYVGTEFGFFISGDEGQEWHRFMNGLPVTRFDDVLVHPRDNDLVLATHGRSVYVMDDIAALQATTGDVMTENVHLYEPREAVQWKQDRRRSRSVTGDKTGRVRARLPGPRSATGSPTAPAP